MSKIIVSEFVSFGHPDKMADQISDALLDAYLCLDKHTKAGIEVMIKDNIVVIGGEVKTNAVINHDSVIRDLFNSFNFPVNHGLNSDNIKIINLIGKQSPEINGGVEQSEGIIGAGDQGFMVGFASDEVIPSYLPLGVYLSKTICQYFSNSIVGIGPDVKSQVTVDYTYGYPNLKHILLSTMHVKDMFPLKELREMVKEAIKTNKIGIDNGIFDRYISGNLDLIIDVNPCGSWEIGGPVSDCGVTGRKIVVDQFGGYCNVGGGGFSGKDSTKVDRSAAYMCRYLAKNIVASGLAKNCKVTLAYMIGVPEPSSINIELDSDIYVDTIWLEKIIRENVDLTPRGIINRFNLKNPIFLNTARDGHYGNDNFGWESLDMVDTFKEMK